MNFEYSFILGIKDLINLVDIASAISNWRLAISVKFSTAQYGAYAGSSLLLYLHGYT